jgi:hypothetical protein
MRPHGLILILSAIALAGCTAPRRPRGAPAPLDALLGTYDLVSMGGKPLPVREHQAIYHGGRITLKPGQRFVSEIDAETCTVDDVCKRETAVSEGSWLRLDDGTLEFVPIEEHEDPYFDPGHEEPPLVEADGKELRFFTRFQHSLTYLYRRP